MTVSAGNTNYQGRLSTVDLLIKAACFLIKYNNMFNTKGIDVNWLVQRGHRYLAFPFSKTSLISLTLSCSFSPTS